jgi:hypothetical protein
MACEKECDCNDCENYDACDYDDSEEEESEPTHQELVLSYLTESLEELRFISSFIRSIEDDVEFKLQGVREQRWIAEKARRLENFAATKAYHEAKKQKHIEKYKKKAEKMIADGQPLLLPCAAAMLGITDSKLMKMRRDGTIKEIKSESGPIKISLEEINRVKENGLLRILYGSGGKAKNLPATHG